MGTVLTTTFSLIENDGTPLDRRSEAYQDFVSDIRGQRGATWFDGSGVPGTILGQLNDDYYLDVDNGDIYQLQSSAWVVIGNIEGGEGSGDYVSSSDVRVTRNISNARSTGVECGYYFRLTPGFTNKIDIYKDFDSSNSLSIVDNFTDSLNPAEYFIAMADQIGIVDTHISEGSLTHFAIDKTGAIIQSSTWWDDRDTDTGYPANDWMNYTTSDICRLGASVHSDRVHITLASQYQMYSNDVWDQFDALCVALGRWNMVGNIYSANGANLKINKSVGRTWAVGGNYRVPIAGKKDPNRRRDLATIGSWFIKVYTGVDTIWTSGSPGYFIDPTKYETFSGLGTVPDGKWTIQYLFYTTDLSTGGITFAQYGQAYYDSLVIAKTHLYDKPVVAPNLAWSVFRGWLIVQKESTELNNPAQAYFQEAPRWGFNSVQPGIPIDYSVIVNQPFIPATTNDLSLYTDKVFVTDDQKSAADAANNPGPSNAFATMNDIPVGAEEIVEAASYSAEVAAFAAGAAIVVRTDLI